MVKTFEMLDTFGVKNETVLILGTLCVKASFRIKALPKNNAAVHNDKNKTYIFCKTRSTL